MKTLPLARVFVPSLILLAAGLAAQTAGAQAAAAPTTCKDGTTSSASGRGACSGHGGVQKAAPAATPAPSSVPASGTASKATAPTTTASKSTASTSKSTGSGNTDPTGATAKCKDGTYSKSKHHSGTCSKHGGVDQWMDGSK
jgi:hypothetical protein